MGHVWKVQRLLGEVRGVRSGGFLPKVEGLIKVQVVQVVQVDYSGSFFLSFSGLFS